MLTKDDIYTILGVGLTVIGSIGNALGYVIQKKGHLDNIDKNEVHEIQNEEHEGYGSNRIWIIGFVLGLIGSILVAAGLKFGPQSVLAPLGALILVANAMFATKILKEPFEKHHLYGILLVVIGSILAVIFGPKGNSKEITLSYIESCWRNLRFLLFFIVLTMMALIDYVLVKIYERKNYEAMENHHITHGANFLMVSYVSLAAYFGATNVLFMKSAVIMIGSFDLSYFANYLFYVTFGGVVFVNIYLEYFRQRALVYFDACYVVPIFQVMLILGSTVFGAIFFNEFASLSVESLIIFIVAIVITLIGVAILAYDVGSIYKKMLKKLDEKTPKNIHITKTRNAMSIRSKGRKAFVKRTHRQQSLHALESPPHTLHGPAAHLVAKLFSMNHDFVYNESCRDVNVAVESVDNAKTETYDEENGATEKEKESATHDQERAIEDALDVMRVHSTSLAAQTP